MLSSSAPVENLEPLAPRGFRQGSEHRRRLPQKGISDAGDLFRNGVDRELVGHEPFMTIGFLGRNESPSKNRAFEREDDVGPAIIPAIHTGEPRDFNLQSCFFPNFTYNCSVRQLAYLDSAAREIPQIQVTTVRYENPVVAVEDDCEGSQGVAAIR